jgi:DNA-binding transcriptional MocR family regulator
VEEAGVAFIPGRAFCAAGGVRLNYSHPAPDEIRDGIRRLGQVLCLRNAVLPPPA